MKNLRQISVAVCLVLVAMLFSSFQQQRETLIEGMGITKSVTMNGGVLHIEGAENNIRVNGFADVIYVEGANCTVMADEVNTVKIKGANVTVRYKKARTKNGLAKSNIFGAGSMIIKVRQ